jgi:formylglycine-generating enzyme required for sulfatase activity
VSSNRAGTTRATTLIAAALIGCSGEATNDLDETDTQATACPTDLAGAPLVLIRAEQVSYCIDAREASQREYGEFLDAIGHTTVEQPPECETNERFEPVFGSPGVDTAPAGACLGGGAFDPVEYGDYSMGCVDWCDARAFCEWAGKRLCGALAGGTPRSEGAPPMDEWGYACTAAGTLAYPYGDTPIAGRCIDSSVPSDSSGHSLSRGSEDCRASESPFDQIRDLVGSLTEWTDDCDDRNNCAIRGGDFQVEAPSCADPSTSWRGHPTRGIRCCADTVVVDGP